MTITFTLKEMIVFLLCILGGGVGVYLVIVLRNANKLIVNANKAIIRNEENITKLLYHLEEVSGNTAAFSEVLKKQFVNYETAINSLIRSGAESLLVISDTTDHIRNLTANFNAMIRSEEHV